MERCELAVGIVAVRSLGRVGEVEARSPAGVVIAECERAVGAGEGSEPVHLVVDVHCWVAIWVGH